MTKYICFLRGINVGGNKLIKMEKLKQIFESLKLKNVSTFIQSGNVLFDSPEKDEVSLSKKIQDRLYKDTGFEVEVFIRTVDELSELQDKNPYRKINTDKIIKVYFTFLASIPPEEKRKSLEALSYDAEQFKVIDREIYTLVHKDLIKGKAVFTNNLFEKKLGQPGTTRDLNTVIKLLNIARK